MLMTPEERKEAAAVMASDGPWDVFEPFTGGKKWLECIGEPSWDWLNYKFRVRPRPIVRYTNRYAVASADCSYASKELADANKSPERIACTRDEFWPDQFDR